MKNSGAVFVRQTENYFDNFVGRYVREERLNIKSHKITMGFDVDLPDLVDEIIGVLEHIFCVNKWFQNLVQVFG